MFLQVDLKVDSIKQRSDKMRLKTYFHSRFKQKDKSFTHQYNISPFSDLNPEMTSLERLKEMRRLKPRIETMCQTVLGDKFVFLGSTDEHVMPLHHIIIEPDTDKKLLKELLGWITLCDEETAETV